MIARVAGFAAAALVLAACASQRAERPLFDAMRFDAWRVVGGQAAFELSAAAAGDRGPTLVGRGPIQRNGFLASPREVGDFRLALDVRLGSAEFPAGEGMNSGIQIRSAEKGGAIAGLQIEVDPTERRWSGGVYDERGRGWLAPLKDNAAAMAAFKSGEWNRYEIECIGPRVRTRVNGVDCAEWYDGVVSGLLAFQVHAGPACEVAFRAPIFEDLGAHAWRDAKVEHATKTLAAPAAWDCALPSGARGVRIEVERGATAMLVASDGTRIAELACAPKDEKPGAGERQLPEAARREIVRLEVTRLEIVWLEGKGAALVDGARVATFAFVHEPALLRLAATTRPPARPAVLVQTAP